jgi:uracil-DNA glycosylase
VGSEVNACNPFLVREIGLLQSGGVVLALGGVAHRAVLKALGLRQAAHKFGHGAEHSLPGDRVLIDSYHCSRYNTQTRRLTDSMFAAVFRRAQALLDAQRSSA